MLYLFGTPGQDRFAFLWDDLVKGAVGAVVLVDTRRVDQCHHSLGYFEKNQIPFAIGVNHFAGSQRFDIAEIREALDVPAHVPVLYCDARNRESVKEVLIAVLEAAMAATGAVPR